MAHARLFVNEKKVKQNGRVAIYALVQIDNKTLHINTGVSVPIEKYDRINERINGNTKEDKDNNLIIDKCLSLINEIFVRYRLQHRTLTADLLLREYRNQTLYIDFYAFMDKCITSRVMNKDIGEVSAKHHRVLLNKLKAFKPVMSFSEIDYKMITQFKNYCRVKRKNDVNTVHKMLSYWQTYMNIAKSEEIITVNPFDQIQFKRIEPQRIYLTEKELKSFFELYDEGTLPEDLHKTLRHFLFMCLTGIRISDFLRLKPENVQENVLRFVPHKTHSKKRLELHIPLITKAKKLIMDENHTGPFIFDSISEQKMNVQIKQIAPLAKVHKEITNHSARHTFATIFLEKTSDVVTLQRLLGHSNIRETMIYVHISNAKINSQMLNFDQLLKL